MSAHLLIQTAIVAALTAAPAVAAGNVKANVVRPFSAGQTVACVVRLVQSRAPSQQVLGGFFTWDTRFDVECMARGANGAADPVAAVDALLDAVWNRLSTLDTTGLGVIDVRMQPNIDWQVDEIDLPVASATVSLLITHRTASTSLAAQT